MPSLDSTVNQGVMKRGQDAFQLEIMVRPSEIMHFSSFFERMRQVVRHGELNLRQDAKYRGQAVRNNDFFQAIFAS